MEMIGIFAILTFMPYAFPGEFSSFDEMLGCDDIIRQMPRDSSPVTVRFTIDGKTKRSQLLIAVCEYSCEICATIAGISEPVCSVDVKFSGPYGMTDRTETCLERESAPYCSKIYLKIKFSKLKAISLVGVSFDVVLTAAEIPADSYKTSTNWGFIGGIIGGVIGGITTIVIVMIWIIVTCRKSRSGDQRHSPGSTAPLTHLSSPSYQLDESYTNQTSQGNKNTTRPY